MRTFCGALMAAAALLTGTTAVHAADPAPGAGGPAPGAAGIGDPLYPRLGNGGYDVEHYDLHLTHPAKRPEQTVIGRVTITARATRALSRFNLDFAGTSVREVIVDGRPAMFRRDGDELVITPKRPLSDAFTAVVDFTTTPVPPGGERITTLVPSPDGTAVSSVPAGRNRIFPCNNHPRDRATYTFVITAPRGWTATATGTLESVTRHGGAVTTTYRETRPMSADAVQIAVGDFLVHRRAPVDGVAVRDVVPRRLAAGLLPKAAAERAQLAWMTRQLGRYPFGEYGTLIIDTEDGVAVGTQSLSLHDTLRFASGDELIRPVTANTLARQWFGAAVSPNSWADVWLSEGHADFYELLYAEQAGILDDWAGSRSLTEYCRTLYRTSDQTRAEYGPPARPRPATDSTGRLLTGGATTLGTLALYALRNKVGADRFRIFEKWWLSEHEGRDSTTRDFIALASHVTGEDLWTFLNDWLYGARTPPMPGHPDWTVDPVEP